MANEKQNRVKPHILLIGLVLVAFNSYWCLMGTEVWHSTQLTIASLFFNAVFTLLVFVLLNLLLKRFFPRLAMSQADLQTIYVMVVMVTTISGHTMMGYLIPVLAHTSQFATPENEWLSLFGNNIPTWLAVKSPRILDGFYNGDSTLYNPSTLNAWIPPVLAWSSFVIALWLTLLAVTVFLRKQWTENERLNYPIVQLPLALTTNPKRFFSSPWMWLGFAIAGSVELLNGLSFLFPEIPSLPIRNKSLGQFSSKPWSAIGNINISFYPFSIGLMFFTPLDLSFSCWFFWVLTRVQLVVTDMFGARNIYNLKQQTGAWIAFGCIPLWMGRRHYGRIIRKVFGLHLSNKVVQGPRASAISNQQQIPDDSGEPMRYRSAAGLFVVGMMFLFFFCFQMGMAFWAIALFFLLYFPMILGITRIRAEIGPPLHQLILVDPGRTMVLGLGTRRLGVGNLTGLTFLYPFVRCFRAHPTPSELEAFRLAEGSRIGYRQLLIGMILAIVFGIVITFWAYLHVLYDMGAGSRARGWIVYMGWETFNRLQTWLVSPRETAVPELGVIGSSFMFTIFLMIMKTRFLWWPLHPGGYVLVSGTGMGRLWFPIFLSWLAKATVLKIGGVKLYRQAVPFFLGLILGDYTLGCVWSLIGLVLKMPTYIVWH